MDDGLFRRTAIEVVQLLRTGEVSPTEVLEASLARIADVEPHLNALPMVCDQRARHAVAHLDPKDAHRPVWLAGLPIAIKDLMPVAGVTTTSGSTLFADHVPERSDLLVERLEANGAVVVAKSNTPEFGAGANTFNEVYGETRNPWDTARTAGGSSGGAAAALASGEVWLAQGSDLGGSLRTPAAFCGVVGLRPSPGRVARGPEGQSFDDGGAQGPMARNVTDAALLLDAMGGRDPRDPLSLDRPEVPFLEAVRRAEAPARVAFSPDLDGFTPVDAEVATICEHAVRSLEPLGTEVVPACPDLTGLYETYHAVRGQVFADLGQRLDASAREVVKPEIRGNIDQGERMTGAELARARARRSRLYQEVVGFLTDHTVLACPGAVVPPPPVEVRYLDELHGHRFETYIDWVKVTFLATTVSCPALVLPAGFTRDGLPVGLQLIGSPRGEATVLAVGAVLEQQLGLRERIPIDPRRT